MSESVKQILNRFQSDAFMGRQGRVYTDTSDFMRIAGGDVIILGDGHYLVLRDEVERSYGIPEKMMCTDYMESCDSPLAGEPAYCSRGTSIARDILHVADNGDFGTVVIGRRGVSKAEEFMFDSVSNKIVHSGKDCTIWVVQ